MDTSAFFDIADGALFFLMMALFVLPAISVVMFLKPKKKYCFNLDWYLKNYLPYGLFLATLVRLLFCSVLNFVFV